MIRKVITCSVWLQTLLMFSIAGRTQSPVSPPAAYQGSAKVNYVRTWQAVKPENDPDEITVLSEPEAFRMATQYLDGLGRPLQTVVKKGSLITATNTYADMVSAVVYDDLGREKYKYLPFAANNANGNTHIANGLFKINPFQQQQYFFSDANTSSPIAGQGETWYYGQTHFEASPLSRVLEAFAPGNSWVGTSEEVDEADRRSVKTKYYLNTADDEVRIWDVAPPPPEGDGWSVYSTSGEYDPGQLYKNIMIDEHGRQVIEFKDKDGRVILKKVQIKDNVYDDGEGSGHEDWLCTYYIYDDLGSLCCVIQPEGVKTLAANSWDLDYASGIVLQEQCFRYEYDVRKRMIRKKVPGAAEVWMVYDAKDRLVMVQDGNMRSTAKKQWLYTVYDNYNRPVQMGLLTDPDNYDDLIYHLAGAYSSSSYPNLGSYTTEELTRTFYDDYAWRSSWSNPLSGSFNTAHNTCFDSENSSVWPYPRKPTTSATAVKGMVTGTRTLVLGTNTYLFTVHFYDEKGRLIQVQSQNSTGGTDMATTQYSWSGQPLIVVSETQNANTSPAETSIVVTKMTYDHLGRLTQTDKKLQHTLVDENEMSDYTTTATMEYDALGQLSQKAIGSKKDITPREALETLEYGYNIRGWLLGMNRNFLKDEGNAHFGFELAYDKKQSAFDDYSANTYSAAQYNGNIAGLLWKSAGDGEKRKYDFDYDAANRLLKADFTQYTGGWNTSAGVDFSLGGNTGTGGTMQYDDNGNILELWQKGLKLGGSDWIDKLSYTYTSSSNKLLKVVDAVTTNNKLGDFNDGSNGSANDYDYDVNGNLSLDNNKAISSIEYNHLNLPSVITVTGKGTITYTYDAGGNKLSKTTVETSATVPYNNNNYTTDITSTTTYLGGSVYESKTYSNGSLAALQQADHLQFIAHEEGRIRFAKATTATCTPGPDRFIFDYFIKDHLGNVRLVLTEEQEDICYIAATVEDASYQDEAAYYDIDNSRRIDKSTTAASAISSFDDKIYRVHGGNSGEKTGLGITLKVMAGDEVKIVAESFYSMPGGGPGSPTGTVALSELLSAFVGSGPVSIGHGGISTTDISNAWGNSTVIPGFVDGNDEGFNNARAFVNWILFDEQFKFVDGGADPVEPGGGYKLHDHFINNPVLVTKNGYLYIYVSNESNFAVFFDNLAVTHTPGPVLEETHYYPFGLTMAGISSKALAFGTFQNQYKFNSGNELQAKEFNDGTGLEMFDAVNRLYDPQIGRFWQVDELAESNWEWSLYEFALNNPILFNDPLGLDPETGLTPETAKTLQEVIVVSIPKSYWGMQNLYLQVKHYLEAEGATAEQIVQPSLRALVERLDRAEEFLVRVHEKRHRDDMIALEAGSIFIPTSLLLKLKYLKYVGRLFKWKRGKTAVKTTEEIIEHLDDVVKNGETIATKLGKAMHKAYKADAVIPGVKMKEFILPNGKRIDFIDLAEKVIYELKPNNTRAIRLGTKQLAEYLEEVEKIYGKGFKTVLDTY